MKRMIGMVCALLLTATSVIADEKPAGKRFVAAIDADGYQRVVMTGGQSRSER